MSTTDFSRDGVAGSHTCYAPMLRSLLIALVLVAALPAADPVTPKAAPRIAVLRLAEVLNASTSYKAGVERLKKDRAEASAAMKSLDERLQQLDGQLQVLKPDNDNFARIQEELETTKLKRKMFEQRAGVEMEKRHVALVKGTYKDVRAALTKFCQERGVMLVHLAPNPDLAAPTISDVQLEMGLQTVLYYEPSADITDAFLAYINIPAEPAPAPQAK